MGSGLISIAMTGINAAQAGLLTTGNNISNLSTEGYTRQRTLQASNPSVMTGAGGIGQGVHVVTVERMFSQALTTGSLKVQISRSGSRLRATPSTSTIDFCSRISSGRARI